MKTVEVEHYPLRMGEKPEVVDKTVLGEMTKLCFTTPLFYENRGELLWCLYAHYANALRKFLPEEHMRKNGKPNANLHYHNADHAVSQTGFDATSVTRAILSRENRFSRHLSLDGAFSIPIAGLHHDDGYVYNANPYESFIDRASIHIRESKRAAIEAIDQIGLPDCLNQDKVKKLVIIGIHGTSFPYNGEKKAEGNELIRSLPWEWRKEAQIVRLAVQFADLGGQTSRVDQYPDGLIRLRQEFDICEPGCGKEKIGETPDEMGEKWLRFIEFVEKTVGKTGLAFFGTRDHSFAREWHKIPVASR